MGKNELSVGISACQYTQSDVVVPEFIQSVRRYDEDDFFKACVKLLTREFQDSILSAKRM